MLDLNYVKIQFVLRGTHNASGL